MNMCNHTTAESCLRGDECAQCVREELAKARAEAGTEHAKVIEWMTKASEWCEQHKAEKATLQAENARLRDLLRQTEEMLRSSPHRPIIAVLGFKYHCIPVDETETQAARLRAAMEGKP